MTFYYWTEDTYDSADALTLDNAVAMTMTESDDLWSVSYAGIAAKQIDETVYFAICYESQGVVYSTGVVAYSLGSYCRLHAEDSTSVIQTFVQATAVYSSYAKAYFEA